MKNKNIQIKIEEKSLDHKNTILFSFCDFSEILNNLNFKKGTLFYDYITNCLCKVENISSDSIFFIYADIIKSIVENSLLDIDYNIDEDLEKLVFNLTTFNLNIHLEQINFIFNKLLTCYIETNSNKTFIIFYDSSLLDLNLNIYDNCYLFDISEKNIYEYNLLCLNEIVYFDINSIIEKLESVWPIEFDEKLIKIYINSYYLYLKNNIDFISFNETEYLVYYLLNKFYNTNKQVICKCKLRNNVISFISNF